MTVANLSMPAVNTEYTYTLPANTVQYKIKMRADDVPFLLATTTGKLPTSGDGSAYMTIAAYYTESTAGLDLSGKTLYLQTASVSQVAEIIVYTA